MRAGGGAMPAAVREGDQRGAAARRGHGRQDGAGDAAQPQGGRQRRGQVLHLRQNLRLELHATRDVRWCSGGHCGCRHRGVQRHHLLLRADGYGQDALHGGQGRAAGDARHHSQRVQSRVRFHLWADGLRGQRLSGESLLPGDLQRGHSRPVGEGPDGEVRAERDAGQWRVRERLDGLRGEGRFGVEQRVERGEEESHGGLHADERGLVPLALHLHNHHRDVGASGGRRAG
mmetsp:Transcript_17716/g.43806  ORF Transcript_17716/g.43806 Transcript_17716/m.43806 type:complete len:231 (+) Transcript_17716:219-911(+)